MLTFDYATFPNVPAPMDANDEPIVNEPLLRATQDLLHALDGTGAHYQGSWRVPLEDVVGEQFEGSDREIVLNGERCQTACCLAGWAATLASGVWAVKHPDGATSFDECLLSTDAELAEAERYYSGIWGARQVVAEFGRPLITAQLRAQLVLGLTTYEQALLFDGNNSLEDIDRVIEQIVAGETRPAPSYF